MHLAANNLEREPLGIADIDLNARPESVMLRESGRTITLDWRDAVDDQGRLRRCVVCGCREIFKRYDFPQRLGLMLVIVAAGASIVLFAMSQVLWAMSVLLAAVFVDRIIYLFTGQCLVCYRCRSEFRDVAIDDAHEPWDLSIGEKYRPVRQAAQAGESPRSRGKAPASRAAGHAEIQ